MANNMMKQDKTEAQLLAKGYIKSGLKAVPSSLRKLVVEYKITKNDMRWILKALLFTKTPEQLAEVLDNDKMPYFVKAVIKALLKDYETGSIKTLKDILNRVYGLPTQEIETINTNLDIDVNTLTPEQAREALTGIALKYYEDANKPKEKKKIEEEIEIEVVM